MGEVNETDEEDDRPVTPTNDDCCGNACDPCVFDAHRTLLERWEKRKTEGVKGRREKNVLSAVAYKTFEVTEIEEAAESFVKIRLECRSRNDRDSRIFMNPGQHVILSMNKQSKPYTPISWTRNGIELLIRIYVDGDFSRVLKGLRIGEEIRVRGPYGDFSYERNSFRRIVAFCIGSGIAAIYPIAKSIVDDEDEETRIHLVAGFPSLAHVPLKRELRRLSDYWNVTCTLHISRAACDGDFLCGAEIRRGRLTENAVVRLLESHSVEETLILVCGTDEFNASAEGWIKNLGYKNYHSFS